MSSTNTVNRRIESNPYVEAKRSALVYPIVFALLIPLTIGLKPSLLSPVSFAIKLGLLFFIFAIPGFILTKSIYDWTIGESSFSGGILRYLRPLPPGLVYGSDLKKYSFPYVTVFLILTNSVIFITLPEEFYEPLAFPPMGNPSIGHILLSVFTHTFLHADIYHIAGNMIFLWAFGSAVEPRIGSMKYLGIYLMCVFISSLFQIILLNVQFNSLNSSALLGNFTSIGASGAVAGIMGLFVVRCFFARVTISFPILFLPFLSLPLRIQGTFLVALFFMMDVHGSVGQYEMDGDYTNYWAHVGGYLCGFGLGYLMKFHKAAAEESVHNKAERLAQGSFKTKEALKVYGQILEKEPENESALLFHFNKYSLVQSEKCTEYFCQLVELYTRKDIHKAIELVEEHFPKYLNSLKGDVLLKLGVYYSRRMDLKKARLCLDLSKDREGPWQAKAMLMLSDVYISMDVPERAKALLQEIIERFPRNEISDEAYNRLT